MRAVKRESRLDARGMEVKRSARSTAARGARERRARSRRSSRWRRAARSEGWRARGRTPLSHCCCSSRSIAAASGDAIAPDLPAGACRRGVRSPTLARVTACAVRRCPPRRRASFDPAACEKAASDRGRGLYERIDSLSTVREPETTRRSWVPPPIGGTERDVPSRESARGTFGCRTRRTLASARERISRSPAARAEEALGGDSKGRGGRSTARILASTLDLSVVRSAGDSRIGGAPSSGVSCDARRASARVARPLPGSSVRLRDGGLSPHPRGARAHAGPSRHDAQRRSSLPHNMRLPGLGGEDRTILRFTRARKDTEKSFAMVKKSLEWREESGANQCLSEPLSEAHAATLAKIRASTSATAETGTRCFSITPRWSPGTPSSRRWA